METNRCAAPEPVNENVRDYGPGSPDKRLLKEALANSLARPVEIPLVIDGAGVTMGRKNDIRCPHDRSAVLGSYHAAGRPEALTKAASLRLGGM